ncbi:MAG: hypothetical protein ILA06_01495 [Bacteroidaceae bacterium]|nr:hypothetical protein [Bacteroidaceae bacterium]
MNITKTLRYVFVGQLLSAVLIAVAGETGWLPIGSLSGDDQRTYVLSIVGVALAIIGLPLALKLMHLHYVRTDIWGDDHDNDNGNDVAAPWQSGYTKWSIVRMSLLWLSLLFNLIMYYLLGYNTTCGYLALMTVVAYLFVWPSDDRMQAERDWERER